MDTDVHTDVVTILFTDIEGSTRLWEQEPERMRSALACHDALSRTAVEYNRGTVVKMVGDGMHAAFEDSLDAIRAALHLQQSLIGPEATSGVALRVRCGLHLGVVECRDNDFFGPVLNRAARIMGAAHGGQVLLSQAVVDLVGDRLPAQMSLRDLGAVRLRDLSSAQHVYQLVHPKLRQNFPALRSLETTPHNLPQQVTSFIGRERQLEEVEKLLGKTRLLTLLGVGGIGKTRLSLQVAADVIDDYPDGVWFVELGALTDERLVPPAVAAVFGVKEETGGPVEEALVRYVKERRLLIVLDNCEHLLSACAKLAKQLLQSSRDLTVLASSREPLHVAGETSYHVPTLAVPDKRTATAMAGLARYEAIRLFAARAAAAQPKFQLTHQNAAAVADICHRLDGIPLAIELAAARVRYLSVESIAARLGDRFRLLTGGDQTALPRQQTLRMSIDWSYDLLSEAERVLLRRLSVFAGGWTIAAAEAVGAGGEIDRSQVFELLMQLADKSLVEVEGGGQRYRLLETVREYAASRLLKTGEEDAIRDQHLAFFVTLAEEAARELYGPAQVEWIARVDLDRENILGAHEWCGRAKGRVEAGLKLVASIKRYWVHHGPLDLGYRVTMEALGRVGAGERSAAWCRAMGAAGDLNHHMGRQAEEYGCYVECLAVARQIGDRRAEVSALCRLGSFAIPDGLAVQRKYAEEGLELARELGAPSSIAYAANSLGSLLMAMDELDLAEPLFAEALSTTRELEEREGVAITLLNFVNLALRRGRLQGVREWMVEALAIAGETRSKRFELQVMVVVAQLAAYCCDWGRAARWYGACEAHAHETGLKIEFEGPPQTRPERVQEGMDRTAFTAATREGSELDSASAMAEARAWLEKPL